MMEEDQSTASALTAHYTSVSRLAQTLLDRSTLHVLPRWLAFAAALGLFFLRIYVVQGWFIVAYGLGIYLLNNFIAFLR